MRALRFGEDVREGTRSAVIEYIRSPLGLVAFLNNFFPSPPGQREGLPDAAPAEPSPAGPPFPAAGQERGRSPPPPPQSTVSGRQPTVRFAFSPALTSTHWPVGPPRQGPLQQRGNSSGCLEEVCLKELSGDFYFFLFPLNKENTSRRDSP